MAVGCQSWTDVGSIGVRALNEVPGLPVTFAVRFCEIKAWPSGCIRNVIEPPCFAVAGDDQTRIILILGRVYAAEINRNQARTTSRSRRLNGRGTGRDKNNKNGE